MNVDEMFEPVDPDPSVPDKLLDRTIFHLPRIVRVDVERRRGTSSWKKINGFVFDGSAQGDTDAAAEEVSSMIVKIAQADHDQDGGTIHYRAKFHVRNDKGQVNRKTFVFKMTDESDEAEPTMDKMEEQEVLAVAFDRAVALINIQNTHIDNLLGRLITQSETQAGQTAPLLQTIETLVSKYHEGLNMQATALQAMAEMERSGKEIEAKAERDAKIFDLLSAALPVFASQLGAFIGKKKVDEAVEVTGTARTVPQPSGPSGPESAPHRAGLVQRTATRPQQDKPQEPPPMEKPETPENPLTMFAHAFRDSIQSEQWLALSESLSKEELRLLKEATTASDDATTAAGIVAFKDKLRPTKYLRLNAILDVEQREMIGKLLEVIDQYIGDEEEDEEEEAEDEEAEDEEDDD